MTWEHHIIFAAVATVFWIAGSVTASTQVRKGPVWTISFYSAGVVVYAAYIAGLWVSMQRPPLMTLGETRLWYSLFLSLSGLITYIRWRYKWILSLTTVMSLVFVAVNVLRPGIHEQVLMPVLQSIWFIPHVTVYMFSYALLACTFLLAVAALVKPSLDVLPAIDKLSRAGLSFFTAGMLLGALLGKTVLGDYWTWDPKRHGRV